MDKLLSDSTKTEISKKVMDILRAYHISNWHSEPYHQNQNPAEWRYRTIKSWTNAVMNRSGAPANCWLLCMIHVCYSFVSCSHTNCCLQKYTCRSLPVQFHLFILSRSNWQYISDCVGVEV